MRNENYNTFEDPMEDFIRLFKELPQPTLKILNIDRFKTMLQTAAELPGLLREKNNYDKINISIDEMFNLGAVSVDLETFIITDPAAFSEIINKANNFEVYPLRNGNVRLDITFYDVLKSVM